VLLDQLCSSSSAALNVLDVLLPFSLAFELESRTNRGTGRTNYAVLEVIQSNSILLRR
jgi:hypothetical protein